MSFLSKIIRPESSFARKMAHVLWTTTERAEMYELLAFRVENRDKLNNAVEVIYQMARQKSELDGQAIVMREVLEQMNRGLTFADAMAPHVPPTEVMMLRAMEKGGDEAGVLMRTSEKLFRITEMRAEFVTAAFQPIVLSIFGMVFMELMANKAVPALATMLSPTQWTGAAKAMYYVSWFITSWYALGLFVGIVGLVSLAFWSRSRWTGSVRLAMEWCPPYSGYKFLEGTDWLLTLGTLLAARQKLTDILEQMSNDAGPWLYERISAVQFIVNQGNNLGVALVDSGYAFPDIAVARLLHSMADLENFDAIVLKVGQRWTAKGLKTIKAKTRVYTIVSLVAIVGVIILMVLGIQAVNQQIASMAGSMKPS